MASSHRQQIGFRRGRRPLGDLTSQQNNLQNLQKQGQQFPGKPVSIILVDISGTFIELPPRGPSYFWVSCVRTIVWFQGNEPKLTNTPQKQIRIC